MDRSEILHYGPNEGEIMINITGKRFSRWVAQEPVGQDKGGNWLWRCVCDCGSITTVKYTSLATGRSKSCGCLAKEISSTSAITHGMTGTPTYYSWVSMKVRCLNSNAPNYSNYGGRGIKVCERWLSFENFIEDMGQRPKGTSLDRIDNDGDYTPDNCRWANSEVQHRNTRANVNLTYKGRTQCLAAWADEVGIRRNTLQKRIASGWSVGAALFMLESEKYL